jgi:hypothetical protein
MAVGYNNTNPGDSIDTTGGGIDPTSYWSQSPGGQFPGADFFLNQGLTYNPNNEPGGGLGPVGQNGPPGTDPYANTKGLKGAIGRFMWNNQGPSDPNSVVNGLNGAGYPFYSTFSGPGAAYGPNGGPNQYGTGTIDAGNKNLIDGLDLGGGNTQLLTNGPPVRPKGHGGGGGAPTNPWNFSGAETQKVYQPTFVAWQPTNTFGDPSIGKPGQNPATLGPTKFVSAAPPTLGPPPAAPAPPKTAPKGHGHSGGGVVTQGAPIGGGGPAIQGGPNAGKDPSKLFADWVNQHGGQPTSKQLMDYLGLIQSAGGHGGAPTGSGLANLHLPGGLLAEMGGQNVGVGPKSFADPTYSGIDTNMIERGTPGWLPNPTTQVSNTGGWPLSTPVDQGNMTPDQWGQALREQGFGTEYINQLMGQMSLSPWGAGPVMADPSGGNYHFMNINNQGPQGPGLGTTNFPQGWNTGGGSQGTARGFGGDFTIPLN